MDGDYFDRLADDPPEIWSMGWVADYPGPNDFLGILLGTGSSNNYGRWSSPAFDKAIADALATTDPAAARAAFDRAEEIVRDEAPMIPLTYDVGGRCRGPASSAPARTGSGSSGWPGSRGRSDDARRGPGPVAGVAASWVACRRARIALIVVAPAVAADPVTFGTPTATSTFGKVDRVRAAGHARAGPAPASSSC